MSVEELIGAWRLLTYHDVDEANGDLSEGPLGPDPRGLLIYADSGHVSVGMMRGSGDPSYMGYAGTWRLDGTRVVHEVRVASHSHLVGTDQVRDAVLDGHRLTLRGTAVLDGHRLTQQGTVVSGQRRQRRVLVWERERDVE
ncbi:lipocalin-like domain-containing protein [Nocardiopsis nanhaiensis]